MRPVHDSGNTGQKQKHVNSVREQMKLAREKWTDVERRIRQRMRIYPEKLRAMMRSRAEHESDLDLRLPAGGRESVPDPESGKPRPKPITSVRGRDAEEIEPEHPLAS
jgi:hypothetical protein